MTKRLIAVFLVLFWGTASLQATPQADMTRWSLLHLSAATNDTRTLIWEIGRQGTVLSAELEGSGWTPLHVALLYNSGEAARLLIQAGASLTASDQAGRTV